MKKQQGLDPLSKLYLCSQRLLFHYSVKELLCCLSNTKPPAAVLAALRYWTYRHSVSLMEI